MWIRNCLVILAMCVAQIQVQGQNNVPSQVALEISKDLKSYEVQNLDISKLQESISNNNGVKDVQLSLSKELDVKVHIFENQLLSDDYRIYYLNDGGRKTSRGKLNNLKTYSGYIIDEPNSEVSLTMNEQFIYGFIKTSKEVFFIQPLEDYTKIKSDDYLVYNVKEVDRKSVV